jgi:hypothetical protein
VLKHVHDDEEQVSWSDVSFCSVVRRQSVLAAGSCQHISASPFQTARLLCQCILAEITLSIHLCCR